MLGHGDHQAAAGGRHPRQLRQHLLVLVDVLEHVEGAQHVPLVAPGQPARVELEEVGLRQPLARVLEAVR